MRAVTKYQSEDGNLYETAEDAIRADRAHDLLEWLEEADTYWRELDIDRLIVNVLHWVDRYYDPKPNANSVD